MLTSGRPVFDVLEPGLLTTVQDLGRPDAAPLGVPRSGACDPLALAAANLLVGNPAGAAALEVSLLGPVLRARRACLVAISGSDFEASVDGSEERPRPGRSFTLGSGATLRMAAAEDGARGYVAIRGGINVPLVLGSASTAITAGFGGFHGRPLAAGDVISAAAARSPRAVPLHSHWPGPGPASGVPTGRSGVVELRVVRGPHADDLGDDAWDRLIRTTWDVDPHSDRMGVRLAHPADQPAPRPSADGSSFLSLPMTWGAIELPPGGAPICLLADHPTVGGYPVIAVVAAVDLPTLGQLRLGHRVRFQPVDPSDAQAAFIRAEWALDEAAQRLGAPSVTGTRRG